MNERRDAHSSPLSTRLCMQTRKRKGKKGGECLNLRTKDIIKGDRNFFGLRAGGSFTP